MSPGETRALYFPAIMTESIHIRRTGLSSTGISPNATNFSIYQFDGGCPPLTGPVDIKTTSENMTLLPANYVYRSVYLNAGSIVHVNLTAWTGGVEIYLFRGELAFSEWRDHPEYRYSSATATRSGSYVARNKFEKKDEDSGAMKPLRIEHDIMSSDTFYLVYYNRKRKKTATITSDVQVQRTTHNLEEGKSGGFGIAKTCLDGMECSVKTSLWTPQCTIIRAKGGSSDLDNDLDRYPILSLQIARYRRWSVICIITLIPVFLAILYADGGFTCGGADDYDGEDFRRLKRSSKSHSLAQPEDVQVVVHPTETTPLTKSSLVLPQVPPTNDTRHVSWASPIDKHIPNNQHDESSTRPSKKVSWAPSIVVFDDPPDPPSYQKKQVTTPSA